MSLSTIVIAAVLVVAVIFSVRSAVRHCRGEGGCCGGVGRKSKKERKRHMAPVVAEKYIYIEGMQCRRCRENVARSLEELDGVVADVSLKEGRAFVSMEKEIGDEELSDAVARAGFSAVRVEPAGKDGAS